MTGPLIQVFNADNYYGTGELPPQPSTGNCATLSGNVTLSGNAKISCAP